MTALAFRDFQRLKRIHDEPVSNAAFNCNLRPSARGGHAAGIIPVLEAVDGAVAATKAAYPDADCIIPLTHQDMVGVLYS